MLYSIPKSLRANLWEVNYNERAFITITGEQKKDPQFFDHVSCRILSEKYKHSPRKVDQGLFSL